MLSFRASRLDVVSHVFFTFSLSLNCLRGFNAVGSKPCVACSGAEEASLTWAMDTKKEEDIKDEKLMKEDVGSASQPNARELIWEAFLKVQSLGPGVCLEHLQLHFTFTSASLRSPRTRTLEIGCKRSTQNQTRSFAPSSELCGDAMEPKVVPIW